MLRLLSQVDIPALVDIEIAAQISPWSEEVFNNCLILGSKGWVVETDNKITAFLLMLSQVGEGHILNIAVHPDYQRKGLGHLLLATAIAEAEATQLKKVYLEVRYSNKSAINLYKKLGFKQIGLRKNYYPISEGREDALVFAMELGIANQANPP